MAYILWRSEGNDEKTFEEAEKKAEMNKKLNQVNIGQLQDSNRTTRTISSEDIDETPNQQDTHMVKEEKMNNNRKVS